MIRNKLALDLSYRKHIYFAFLAVDFYDDLDTEHDARPPDPVQEQAEEELRRFFSARSEQVFFSRQVELAHEDRFFHWITNRALRSLIDQQFLASADDELRFGGKIKLIWKKSYRFYRRSARQVVDLVSEYSLPIISEALGHQGEIMVLEALARNGFRIVQRNTAEHSGNKWSHSEHDLDLIVERDGIGYGVEVKNTLPYIRQEDFETKKAICAHLGLRPIFAVRMMPKTWIYQLKQERGYALILKSQYYPWGQKALANRVAHELGLPVVCVAAIEQGLIDRLLAWHGVNRAEKSP
jgi:hypothetical protein